ncbi:tetraacyldisaccharide 4'-kinase [Candidatus Levibacter sp. Uisw_134_01]|uniref:tetraacyldisaccharide 4'-kinase n=1 Tax=Candidatus Levibacter sp. Uisw_134_01 TaxID=3230999 RepID=UPI003D4F8CB2
MINTPEFWYKKDVISRFKTLLLIPFSIIWILLSLIKKNFAKRYKSHLKVICIGNLSIGGTGKTPFSIQTYKILEILGYKPVFLTRGYRGLTKGPILVNKSHNHKDVGDEALLLSKVGTTIVSSNRCIGAKYIENLKKNYDMIIMDDGLQNYQLEQDIKLLLIDKKLLFGNGYCIPAGPLRQTITQGLKKIDAIIFTGDGDIKDINLNFINNIQNFDTKLEIKNNFKTKQNNFLAFCALGNPIKFFNTLKKNNFNIVLTKSFPDHYEYKNKDINTLREDADNRNLKLITTEKDYVKIDDKENEISVLPIEINFSEADGNKFKSFLKEKIND